MRNGGYSESGRGVNLIDQKMIDDLIERELDHVSSPVSPQNFSTPT
jgi:hypothetical protein